MSQQLRYGILGTGNIARQFAASFDRRSRQPGRGGIAADAVGRMFAQVYRIPQAFGSYEELIASPAVDAVYVSLPNSLHHDWTIRGAAGRQARVVREADRQQLCRGAGDVRRGAANRPGAHGGVHVSQPPADARRAGCGTRREDRPGQTHSHQLLFSRLEHRGQCPFSTGHGRRSADGHRLLLHELFAADRRRRADGFRPSGNFMPAGWTNWRRACCTFPAISPPVSPAA